MVHQRLYLRKLFEEMDLDQIRLFNAIELGDILKGADF